MLPLIPLIMAVASLGLGVAQGVSSVQQTQDQINADDTQTRAAITERARQGKKLMQQQQTSFLKSGVYFEGTPEAVIDETGNTTMRDTQAMENDAVNRQNLLKRQGNTAFYSSLMGGVTGAATSFLGLGGMGATTSNALTTTDVVKSVSGSRIGTDVQNWYSGLRGWSKGTFDSIDKVV
ncbi:MAG: hypothetical protein WCG95_00055 [bacterium]